MGIDLFPFKKRNGRLMKTSFCYSHEAVQELSCSSEKLLTANLRQNKMSGKRVLVGKKNIVENLPP